MKKYLIEAIEREKTALDALSAMSLQECERVMAAIEECKGKVVFCGVGKSAHIGAKLAATFASLGIPSFFVHATENDRGKGYRNSHIQQWNYTGGHTGFNAAAQHRLYDSGLLCE